MQRVQSSSGEALGLGTTVQATLNGIGSGSLVVAMVTWDDTGTFTSLRDDLALDAAANATLDWVAGTQRWDHRYWKNYGGGNRTFTLTTSSTDFRGITVVELAGADPVSPAGPSTSATGTSAAPSSGAVTPAKSGAYFLGTAFAGSGQTPAFASPFAEVAVSTGLQAETEEYVQPVAASLAAQWTLGVSAAWGALVSTYYPAIAVTPITTIPRTALLFPNRPFGKNNPLIEVKYYCPPTAAGGVNTPVGLDVVSPFDPALTMQAAFQCTLAAAGTWTAGVAKQLQSLRTLAVSSAFAPAIARGAAFLRSLSASSAFAPGIQRGFARALSVSSTFTAAITAGRAYARTLLATSAFNPSLLRGTTYQRALAISTAFTAALTRAAAHPRTLAVTSAFAVSLQKTVAKLLAVSSTFAAAMLRTTVYKRALAVTSTFTPTVSRTAAHGIALAVATAWTVAMTVGRGFFRTVAVGSTFTPSLSKIATHAYFQALAVTSTFTAAITRKATYLRTLATATAWPTSLTRVAARSRTLAATSAMAVAIRRGISMRLAVASPFVGTLNRGIGRLLAVVVPFVTGILRGTGAVFQGFLTHIQSAFQVRALDAAAFEAEGKPDAAFEVRSIR